MTIWFDFYGLVIEVTCSRTELVEEVRRDFSFFQVDQRDSQVVINMHLEAPSYSGLPEVPATVLTPRNVSFLAGRTTYIDYFGRGLGVYDRDQKRCDVYTEDEHLLREIVYLFILSTAGQHLDKRGLHRLHALGVSYNGRGVLLLLPSGGGKSTMALALLGEDGFLLLSEDTPLIDRKGRALPFHLPLGIRIGNDTDIPKEYLRTVRRMEFEPKTLVDLEFFKDRLVSDAVEPGLILIGQRNLGQQSKIVRISKFAAFKSLVKYMVVGLGVYQGLEFLLEKGLFDAVRNVGVGFSRLYNSVRLLFRARAYRFVLGRDHEKNRRTLIEFLKRELGDPQSVEDKPATRATS
jgi:hypothetical protein